MAATPDATKLLYDIVHHVKTAPSGEVTPTTIAPIFRFLRPAKIPKSERPTTADRERVNLATDALKAFVEVGSSEHMLSTPALIARILEPDGWPSIWKWLQFMREKCVLQKSYGEDACTSAVIGIATTLEVLRRHTNLRIAVTTTSGVLELIMEQWLHASDHARLGTNLSDAGYHYIQSRLMLALGGLLESTDATPKSPVGPQIFGPQILAGAGGDSKLVATTALSRLRTSVADANAPETDVGPHLMLMYNLSGQCQAIHLALANEGLIPVIIEVLSWCNARPAQAKPANTLNECYRNLLRVFYSTNGAVWVVQALDSGLITAMLRSGSWLATVDPTDFAVELCERFLDEVLSKYTVFRSVLRAVRRALRQVEKRRLGTKAVVGCLWDAWQKFKAFAEVRLGMLDLWDERGGRAASEACTYPKCSNSKFNDDTMKRCSGCMGPLYCSKECQRLDWPLHKNGCKFAQKLLQLGRQQPRNRLDTSFIYFLSEYEVRRYLPGILMRVAAEKIPTQTIALDVNLAVVPPVLNVITVMDPHPQSAGGSTASLAEDRWNDTIRRAQGYGGDKIAVRTRVPNNEGEERWLIIFFDLVKYVNGVEGHEVVTAVSESA